jgi:hypothetical protein
LSVRSLTALFLLFFAARAFAWETSTLNSSVRALGMGDAYTALADDESSFFYNPAGLARVRGLNLRIFDVDAGVSGVSAYNKIRDIQGGSGSTLADSISGLYGEHVWTGVGGDSFFTMPMFGFGVYDHAGALMQVNNPVYPQMHTKVINDYGYVMGVGVPAGLLHMGMDLKYIKRMGTDTILGPAAVADLQSSNITSQFTGWGVGYGADLGANVVIPAPFFRAVLSAAWKNVGGITFKSANGTDIPSEPNNITLGAGLKFDTPLLSVAPAVDVNYLNDGNLQLTRKINFGVEIGLPLIDLRGGFHEGYYTAGLGVNMGLFRVDAATYGVELGAYPGQSEDRRYVLQFTMQLGVGSFSADGSSKSGSGGKNGRSANSTSDSIWGGKRLKQRR